MALTSLDRLHAISGRPVAIALALALLAAGCGGGDDDQAQATRTPTSTPSPAASPFQVGGEGTTNGNDDAGTNGSGEREPVATPVADDPADTLRALFDAIEAEDYSTQVTLTAGGVQTLMRIRDIIRQENARRGATTTNEVTIQESAELAARDGDDATVSVRANVRSTVSGEQGTLPSDATVEGPVRLRRVDGAWRVWDLVYSGRALADEYFPVDERQTRNDIRLELPAFLGYKETTAALLRFVNEAEGGVPLHIRRAVIVGADGEERTPTQLAIGGQDAPTIFLGFDRMEGRPASLRVEVRNEETGRGWSYNFTF